LEAISASELDLSFKAEVAARLGGANIKACFACGACTGGCPVSEVSSDFDPRRMIRMIVLGMKKELLSSPELWLCQLCNTCSFVCPQDVRFSEAMGVLRQMAVEGGFASEDLSKRMAEVEAYSRRLRAAMLKAAVEQTAKGEKLEMGKLVAAAAQKAGNGSK
jgi:heterodisulfide reductase subunit C